MKSTQSDNLKRILEEFVPAINESQSLQQTNQLIADRTSEILKLVEKVEQEARVEEGLNIDKAIVEAMRELPDRIMGGPDLIGVATPRAEMDSITIQDLRLVIENRISRLTEELEEEEKL